LVGKKNGGKEGHAGWAGISDHLTISARLQKKVSRKTHIFDKKRGWGRPASPRGTSQTVALQTRLMAKKKKKGRFCGVKGQKLGQKLGGRETLKRGREEGKISETWVTTGGGLFHDFGGGGKKTDLAHLNKQHRKEG